jgi:hypothetical protein
MGDPRCKHELLVGQCATCLGQDHVEVPDPWEGWTIEELGEGEPRYSGDRGLLSYLYGAIDRDEEE